MINKLRIRRKYSVFSVRLEQNRMEQLLACVLRNSSSYDFEKFQHWSVLSVEFSHVFMLQKRRFAVSRHLKTASYLPVCSYHVTYTFRVNVHSAVA